MIKRNVYHILPNKTGGEKDWKVTKEGNKQAISRFENKEEAIKKAQNIAKNKKPSQIKIHGRNGKIQREYTYEADPRKYKS